MKLFEMIGSEKQIAAATAIIERPYNALIDYAADWDLIASVAGIETTAQSTFSRRVAAEYETYVLEVSTSFPAAAAVIEQSNFFHDAAVQILRAAAAAENCEGIAREIEHTAFRFLRPGLYPPSR